MKKLIEEILSSNIATQVVIVITSILIATFVLVVIRLFAKMWG
jgi:hypothetical protein